MNTTKLITLFLITFWTTGCAYLTQGPLPDSDRGALVMENKQGTRSLFNPAVENIVYPEQGWSKADSLWFYNTTQGSNLLHYDIFLHLEQANSTDKFRSNKNMQKYRYLVQKPTFGNRDGLPLGWVKDNHLGRSYIGLTCAACHTGQINYRGTGIRIDGGSTLADMEQMLYDLESALKSSLNNNTGNNEKFDRLATKVLGSEYNNEEKLAAFSQRLEKAHAFIKSYTKTNYPYVDASRKTAIHYGYARLDAFGRIFNRILAKISDKPVVDINSANAPVSYPFLWDTPFHDFVQWNGIADNGATLGLGPLGRNIGEVLGVFASIDIHYKNPGNSSELAFLTSADSLNLARLERHLKSLMSPKWKQVIRNDEMVLPKINEQMARKGREDFISYGCIACHADIKRDNTNRRVIAQFTSHEKLGTDTIMAENALTYCGDSGKLVNSENSPCATNGELEKQKITVASALSNTVTGVIKNTKDKRLDLSWTRDMLRKAYVGLISIFGNPVRNTQRHVDFEVVNKGYIAAYKGRPLNGIWATAPYLHNGSVPSLYDLLLPKCKTEEFGARECRPNQFSVGNPEFDPVKVGYIQSPSSTYEGSFTFDTSIPGNDNAGHEYAAGRTPSPVVDSLGSPVKDENGKITFDYRPAMTHKQRKNMVEYLKSL